MNVKEVVTKSKMKDEVFTNETFKENKLFISKYERRKL